MIMTINNSAEVNTCFSGDCRRNLSSTWIIYVDCRETLQEQTEAERLFKHDKYLHETSIKMLIRGIATSSSLSLIVDLVT